MENYDIVMLVVLVAATLFGAMKGFAWQLASITSIVLSYVVAYRFREPLSQSIQADPPWNLFLAMLILYIGTSLVIWVAFRMISQTIDRLRLKEFDRQVGALFGLAKGALYCILITLFAVTLLGDNVRQTVVQSKSGRYIAQVLERSESVIPPEIQEVVGPYLDKFDQQLRPSAKPENGLAPWFNQVTDNVIQNGPWNQTLPREFNTAPAPTYPSSSTFNEVRNSGYPPVAPSGIQTPTYPASSSLPPPLSPSAATERPWSSVYSSGGN